MKRIWVLFVVWISCLAFASNSFATPVDLSTFTAEPGVVENAGIVTFSEDYYSDQWWFFDDNFIVADNASILSFELELQYGQHDFDDYLEFDLNFSPALFVDTNGSGRYEIDLTAYRGETISLAWALVWGGSDDAAGTSAILSAIDLETVDVNPVPEPATIFLLGIGLAGIAGIGRKKHS